jgi:hypothetical protein
MNPLQFRQTARQLLAQERRPDHTSQDVAASAEQIYRKVLGCVSAILGEAGSVGLFRRSLRLTVATYSFFSGARDTNVDLLLSAVRRGLHAQPAEVAREASVELLAIHLELLATFIGPALTEQLLQEAWPSLRTSNPEESQA